MHIFELESRKPENKDPHDLLTNAVTVVSPRIRIGDRLPNKNVGVETLNHGLVMEGMATGNGLILYGPHGQKIPLCKVEGASFFPSEKVDDSFITYSKDPLTGGFIRELMHKETLALQSAISFVAVSGWGESPTFMWLYNDGIPAIVDVNEAVLGRTLEDAGIVGKELQKKGYSVGFGGCVSAANLETPGLQSVLEPHVGIHGTKNVVMTHEEIKKKRRENTWDQGLSKHVIGEPVARIMNDFIFRRDGGYTAVAESDSMGFTAYIGGLTLDNIAEKNEHGLRFINELLRPLSHTIHAYYKEICFKVFQDVNGNGTNLDDVIQHVLDASKNGVLIDVKEFNARFFHLSKKRDDEPAWVDTFRELERQGKLRHPPGWAFNLQFDENGAFLTVLSSFVRSHAGAAESIARKLIRPTDEMSEDERLESLNFVATVSEKFVKPDILSTRPCGDIFPIAA